MMKIAIVQLNPVVGDLAGNTEKIKKYIVRAAAAGADLIIFPELAITGYPPRDLLLYEAFIRETRRCLTEEIMPLTKDISVITGSPWPDQQDGNIYLYNGAVFMERGEIVSVHYKTLLPDYDVFDESRYFTPAREREPVLIKGFRAGITVCEDIWNDKDYHLTSCYRLDPVEELFSKQAELLINISASPYYLGKAAERQRMLEAVSLKYRAPVIYVNQVGGNDELIFDGSSMVCADGELICRAEPFREEVFYLSLTKETALTKETTLTTASVSETEQHQGEGEKSSSFSGERRRIVVSSSGTYTADISTEAEDMKWVYGALQLGLRDYLQKTGFSSVVLGLSGGIDSAVVAAVAAAALGPDNVLGVMMPSRYSSSHSVDDADKLARNLGIKSCLVPIEEAFKAFHVITCGDREMIMDVAEENLQSRIRGSLLMLISNREGHMLLTTGNKSETAVGYCTLYGDMNGGLAVISDLPKMMVYDLAEYINQAAARELIPRSIIEKPPSAELRPDQKDQDSLPPYEDLDRIINYYIEENLHISEIAAKGFDPALVEEIIGKIDRAEYKRYQASPGLKITTRAFGYGRRMPLARGFFKG